MRVRLWIIGLLIVVLVLVAAQVALQRYAESRMDRLLTQWRGWAEVNVAHSRFRLWGVADFDRVSITPQPWLSAMYGLPLGYTVTIDRLRLHRLRPGWNGGLVLASADLDARGVHLPLPQWNWTITLARDTDGNRLLPPTLQSLGLSSLDFDLQMRGHFRDGWTQPELLARTTVPGLGGGVLDCRLNVPPGAAADPGTIAVRRCRFDYRDLGLAGRFERAMAGNNHVGLAALQAVIAEQVGLDAARAHWPLLSTQAIQSFVHQPQQLLRLRIAPPRELPLDKIPRGIWPGLPALLGLTAELPSESLPDDGWH